MTVTAQSTAPGPGPLRDQVLGLLAERRSIEVIRRRTLVRTPDVRLIGEEAGLFYDVRTNTMLPEPPSAPALPEPPEAPMLPEPQAPPVLPEPPPEAPVPDVIVSLVNDDLAGFFDGGDEDQSALSWQERALCAQTDPEAFFPEKGGSTREAKRVCRSCEVRAECLEYALDHDERFGIWGGLSERERRRLKREAY